MLFTIISLFQIIYINLIEFIYDNLVTDYVKKLNANLLFSIYKI